MTESTIQSLQPGINLKSSRRTYRIIKVLGSGSFGITYLATSEVFVDNISATMKFAIKEHFISASCYRGEDGATVCTVPNAQSDVIDSRADFITEANRLKKLCLKSRNIVSVNETFEANGTAYYVMEFLDGGSPSRCSEDEAISIVLQVAEALKEIHKEHVLHLDLKPDNIVLKTNDRNETYPVLIDFGISKHFDSKGRPTSSLSAKGASPGYAPQEQYAGVSEFSPKYDIYALGAVLFYLCTGKNPPDAFKVTPNQQELKKELTGKVSANIEKAILGAMQPTASERTPSIKQFCDDLRGIDFIPKLNVSDTDIEFGEGKGNREVTVDSNIGWSVYSDEDWCKVSKAGNEIVISVSRNKETGKEAGKRSCDVVVSGSSHQISQVIRIKQEGAGTVVFPPGRSWWQQHSKSVYQAGGFILVGCVIVGLFLLLKPDHKKESELLTQAIEASDGDALRKFAGLDSTRAFLPYARFLFEHGDWEKSLEYATKDYDSNPSDIVKVFIDSINSKIIEHKDNTQTIQQEINVSATTIPRDFVLMESGTLHNREYIGYDEKTYNSIYEFNDYNLDSFYISKFELTQKEYKDIMGELKPYNFTYNTIIPKGKDWGDYTTIKMVNDSLPVLAKYIDFAIYCNQRSIKEGYDGFYDILGNTVSIKLDGNGYRLPTSLEWTFAAKGGNINENFKLIGSNNLKDIAWYGANSGNKPHIVGKKKPNGAGLYDMAGNIQEFMETEYSKGTHYISGADYTQWPYNGYEEWSPYCNSYYNADGRNAIEGCRLVLIPKKNNNLSIVAKSH